MARRYGRRIRRRVGLLAQRLALARTGITRTICTLTQRATAADLTANKKVNGPDSRGVKSVHNPCTTRAPPKRGFAVLIERTVMCAGRGELGFEFSLRENPTSLGGQPPRPPGIFLERKRAGRVSLRLSRLLGGRGRRACNLCALQRSGGLWRFAWCWPEVKSLD